MKTGMKKQEIVINTGYGGFGLSEEAFLEMRKRGNPQAMKEPLFGEKWCEKYPTDKKHVCEEGCVRGLSEESIKIYTGTYSDGSGTNGDREAAIRKMRERESYGSDIPRDNPDLVATVKELGEKASGKYAVLKIVSIPAGVKWTIEENDGNESIHEKHRSWA